jgi:hypothetical protein
MNTFFAVLMLCSTIAQECIDGAFMLPKEYSTHYECVLDAYSEAQMRLATMNPMEVEKYRLYIVFQCSTAQELGLNGI